jgi:hypothetical protein
MRAKLVPFLVGLLALCTGCGPVNCFTRRGDQLPAHACARCDGPGRCACRGNVAEEAWAAYARASACSYSLAFATGFKEGFLWGVRWPGAAPAVRPVAEPPAKQTSPDAIPMPPATDETLSGDSENLPESDPSEADGEDAEPGADDVPRLGTPQAISGPPDKVLVLPELRAPRRRPGAPVKKPAAPAGPPEALLDKPVLMEPAGPPKSNSDWLELKMTEEPPLYLPNLETFAPATPLAKMPVRPAPRPPAPSPYLPTGRFVEE